MKVLSRVGYNLPIKLFYGENNPPFVSSNMRCSKCHRKAVTYIRYNGTHLCREHFLEYVRRRVKKDIKKQGIIDRNSVIGVAVSGGKDSLVTLHLLHEVLSDRRGNKLVAITVDEGIKGYRDKSIRFAIENCEKLDVEHHIVSFKELIGYALDEIVSIKRDERGPCTYCGVFRRQCLNRKAKEIGVTILATGHNLDDMAQSALMNFIKGDIEKIARMGPHTRIQPGLIPRLIPLRGIPEKETTLFALLEDIKYHDGVCPYATEAFRGIFRDIVEELEYKHPGARHGILKSYEIIKELLFATHPLQPTQPCERCGEPTSQRICKACILLEELEKSREKI